MVTDLCLAVMNLFLSWVLYTLPEWELALPAGFKDLVATLRGLDGVLPVSEVFLCMGIGGSLFVAMLGFKMTIKVIDWIADVIP